MQRRYTLAHFILASVVVLGLTMLMIGVDAHAQIAFVSGKNKKADIYVMDADGGNARKLTKNGRSWRPSWSPDGERIAFVSDRGDLEIYVMKADGRKPRNLTNNRHDDGALSWSPDGKHIVFESERDDNEDIYVMDDDGGNIHNLTNNPLAHDRQPAWYRPAFAVAPADKRFTMWGWLKQIAR